ncbi:MULTISPECIES: restriction endonuclease subunit S [unclassified Psychrobacter]|uniref:restriction endonuclease subunit S n=1 Tax=unclassified Psychrobacter TaxID=196806 RepID=UPI0025D1331B|nr:MULTISPECIES: restriction endonuclease subunit S [unclassified Psychrobacter]
MNLKTSLEMSKDMSRPKQLITEHIDIWTSTILAKSTSGRGSSKKYELYGITKLRELILELAVHGKLVPQDANDEPASVLLEKIAVERAQLLEDGKIKNAKKSLKEVTKSEEPYELPEGWVWTRIANLFNVVYGKGLPISKLTESGYDVFGANGIIGKYKIYNYEKPQLLVSCRGAYSGKANLSPPRCFITSNTLVLENNWKYLSQKFYYYSISASDKAQIVTGSAQPQVTATNINPFIVPVPPLAEQHRIVAKVDELMLLCDQLEQQTEASIEAQATLVEVLLATLTDSADADELAQNWARIAEHFDSLFTTEQSIEALKQTVLQLAVMGKLVPQNQNDEPASALLEKIAKEKEQLIKEKKIKKEKPLPVITDDEKTFELPKGWEWCQIDNLSLSSEAGWSPKCDPTPKEGDNWGVLKVSAVTWGKYQPDENKALPNYLQPKPQYEVKAGDFLISRANTADLVARSVVVPKNTPEKLMMSDKIIRFNFTKNVFSGYINLVNNSNYSRQYYAEVAGGTSSSMKNVSRNQVRALNIALPPLAEQQQIVAKLDELMAICDQLKEKLKQSQETQVQLTDALVDRALG